MKSRESFQLGPWTVDPGANRMTGPEGERRIHSRAMDVLLCLADNPGEVVSRDQFSEQVWRDSVVGDDALTWSISELRRCLGDSAANPRFIETIPKRGYRLIAPVRPVNAQPGTGEATSEGASAAPRARRMRPLGLAAVAVAALLLWWAWSPDEPDAPSKDANAIAVLPLSGIATVAGLPLAEGFHADIISRLAEIADLRVTSATSTRRFSESAMTAPEIAEQLGVAWIVEGATQQLGDRFRISVQLVDARIDRQHWSRTYEGELTASRLFTVQDEIIGDIVASIEQAVALHADPPDRRHPTDNLEAYGLAVRAGAMSELRTEHGMRRAAALYEQAVALDADYADAWAGWADTLFSLHWYGYEPGENTLIEARERAERALAFDETHPLALTVTALLAAYVDRNLPEAVRILKDSQQRSPAGAGWLAWFHAIGGRLDQALVIAREQLLSNPYSPAGLLTVATLELMDGNAQRTVELSERAIELSPGYYAAWQILGQALLLTDQHDQALQAFDRALELSENGDNLIFLAWREAARDVPDSETLESILRQEDFMARAIALLANGDVQAGLEALGRIEWDDLSSIRVRYHPYFEPMRGLPGYQELIESINRWWRIETGRELGDADARQSHSAHSSAQVTVKPFHARNPEPCPESSKPMPSGAISSATNSTA